MDKKTIYDINNGLILFALPVRGEDCGLRCDSLFDPSEGNRTPLRPMDLFAGSLQKRSMLYSVMHVLGGRIGI